MIQREDDFDAKVDMPKTDVAREICLFKTQGLTSHVPKEVFLIQHPHSKNEQQGQLY